MNLDSIMKFKGYSYELQSEIDFWGTTISSISAVLKEEIDFDTEGTAIIESIGQKTKMLQVLPLDSIKDVIEKETDKKIRKIKPVNVSFDFTETENEDCSVDIYFSCGKVFGGFTAHIRITDNGNSINMVGLS
ncbi:MAG: hypothetical protein J6C41_01025 [Oscillospiraceae bacterium]|nr:hypothetical protein [Oscillospiraceae bacterium]